MSILVKNGIVVTMDPKRSVIKSDMLVEDDRICALGSLNNRQADIIIEAADKLVIPGLIQSHVHLCQALFRGMADDLELLDWLKLRIWPLEGGHDQESLYYSAMLGCAELLRGGTTSIIDMGTVHHTDSIFQAVKQAGLRYLGGKCMMDCGDKVPSTLMDSTDNALQESLDLYDAWEGRENGRIRYAFCPRFAVSCTQELLKSTALLSGTHNIPVHTHASENREETALVMKQHGMPNVLYLNSLGLCNENLILAHCIHINQQEIEILANSGAKIAHCPASNLKLASGIAPVPKLLEAGACVSLGADGAPCNNNLSMFNEMRLAALIQKPLLGPTAMPAPTVFEMATSKGAEAMGMEKEIGSLEIGKKADFAVVSLDNWHTWPASAAGVYSHLVYQAKASDVRATVVDGQLLMLDGHVLSIDENEVKIKCEKSLSRVKKRVALE